MKNKRSLKLLLIISLPLTGKLIIKLVADDRKWLEGGTLRSKSPLNSKRWASCGARRKVRDAKSSGCAIATESEAVNIVEIVGSGNALRAAMHLGELEEL